MELMSSEAKIRRGRSNFWVFFSLSVFEAGILLHDRLTLANWPDWLVVGGVIFFPIMTLLSFISMRTSRTSER